jgi:ribosomal protein S27E
MYIAEYIRFVTPTATKKKTMACPKCKNEILIDVDTNVDIICNICGSRFVEP